MKYFIVVGEKSGDLHGGNLARSIFKNDPSAIIQGWGGENMESKGVKILKNYSELAFMGFWEVIKNIFTILGFFKLAKKQILEFQPDVLVLIDYAGFNLRLAKWANSHNIKIAYYIAPKAWAWQESRAYKLKKYVNKLLVIFPFEQQFFKKYSINTTFVGNPLFDAIQNFSPDIDFLKNNNLTEKPIIALLPGSRKQEVKYMLGQMNEISEKFPDYNFIVAGVSNLDKGLYEGFGSNIKVIFDETYNILINAKAAIVTSGTATLETALFKVPQVVVYKTSWFSYFIASLVIKIPYISLVNLVAQKEVVKELIQSNYNVSTLSLELKAIVENDDIRERMQIDYENIQNSLGTVGASVAASKEIIQLTI